MRDPIEEIVKTLTITACRSHDQLEYAFYNSLSVAELCDSCVLYINNTSIRNNVIKHLLIKRDRQEKRIPVEFLDKLLCEFEDSEKRRRISIGTALKELSESLNKTQVQRFFESQVFSDRILDRKRAYLLAPQIYDCEIDRKLWESWSKFGDENCMAMLVMLTEAQILSEKFKSIWESEGLRHSIKNNALKRAAKYDFKSILFLKNESPLSYLSACVAACKDISDEELITITENVDSISALKYAIWCLGALGKRNALQQIASRINEIEAKLPKDFNEQLVEMYKPFQSHKE